MPLLKCANGRGWKFNKSGKAYTGADAKKKALKQALMKLAGTEIVKNEQSVAITVPISKHDEDRQFAFGWANVSMADGELVIDSHGDTISIGELEDAAYNFNLSFHDAAAGEMHQGDARGQLIESFVVTPEKLEKMGLAANALPLGWWVGMHVEDKELFGKVKSGEYRAFSIQGMAQRVKGDDNGE